MSWARGQHARRRWWIDGDGGKVGELTMDPEYATPVEGPGWYTKLRFADGAESPHVNVASLQKATLAEWAAEWTTLAEAKAMEECAAAAAAAAGRTYDDMGKGCSECYRNYARDIGETCMWPYP